MVTPADRVTATRRGFAVATVGQVAIAVVAALAAVDQAPDPSATSFWLLACFAALGAGACALGWAALRGWGPTRTMIGAAVLLLAASLVPFVLAAGREDGTTWVVLPVLLLLWDGWLVLGASRLTGVATGGSVSGQPPPR
jgi:peptidoglycan/LPS O-acetylase OafA/YrhL